MAGTVAVQRIGSSVVVSNTTEYPVDYLVMDSRLSPAVVTGPSCGGASCPRLVQGGEATVALRTVLGYDASTSTSVTIYWWRVLPRGPKGYEVLDTMHSVRVGI